MTLGNDLIELLIRVKGNEFGSSICKSSCEDFEDLEILIEQGYLDAKDSSTLADKSYGLLKLSRKGKDCIENHKPNWKSWDKGWKIWLSGAALILGIIFSIVKIIEFISK
jgi:hypothetical protein